MSGIIAQNTLDGSGLIKSPAGGGAWNFIKKLSGSGQSITDGNTATIAAGNGITTTGGATDTVTVAANPAMTPYITSTGKALVMGF